MTQRKRIGGVFIVSTVEDAENAFVIDIDDEMSSVALDGEGYLIGGYSKTLRLRAYYGTTDVTSECTFTESHSDSDIDVVMTNVKTTGAVVSIEDGTYLDASNDITFTCVHPTYGTRTVIFTLASVRSGMNGEPAVLWEVIPSVNQIVKKKDGTTEPTSNITCLVVKTTGGTHETPTSGYTLVYYIDDATQSRQYKSAGIPVSGVTKSVKLVLRVGSIIVDRETIPVVADGTDGMQWQRAYKSTNSSTAPTSQLPVGSILNGWSETPTAITENARYRWKCERHSVNGSWVVWSTPVLDGYMPEDGRSINIKGTAVAVTTTTASDVWPNPSVGDIVLNNDHDTAIVDDIDVCETAGKWDNSYSCEINDGYMIASTGHLWTLAAHRTWVDCGQIRGPKGDDGTSPIFADLDNEMDSVACTVEGKPDGAQTVSTTVSLWKGETPTTISSIGVVDEKSGYNYTSGLTIDGVTATWNATTGVVTFAFATTATFDNNDKRVFHITLNGENTSRDLYFTVNGIRAAADGEPARIFNIVPSLNEVHKNADGTLKNTTMSFQVRMAVGSEVRMLTTFDDLGEYELGIKRFTISGYSNLTFLSTEDDTIAVSLSQLYGSNNDEVTFALVESNPSDPSLIVREHDRETVGSVYDGQKASAYFIETNNASVTIPANATSATWSGKVSAFKRSGDDAKEAYSCYLIAWRKYGATYERISYFNGKQTERTLQLPVQRTASRVYDSIVFTMSDTILTEHADYLAEIEIPVYKVGDTGAQGQTGKTGRFYYYAGEFDSTDDSDSNKFAVSDIQVPYFKDSTTGKYWLFDYGTNGNYTMADMWEISNQSFNKAPWKAMVSEFKYIITEAIFGSYAHFGASIISGDFLMSQYGFMRGFGNEKIAITNDSQYQNIDPDDVFGESDIFAKNKLIWNIDPNKDYTNTSYIAVSSSTYLTNGKYYTIDIEENTSATGGKMQWRIISGGGNVVVSGEIESHDGETIHDNCATFICNQSGNYTLQVKVSNASYSVGIHHFSFRACQFVPWLVIDMKSGKLVANNIVARGELHADGLVYEMVYGNSNNDTIVVTTQSIVNLGTQSGDATSGYTTVRLPNPTSCKGRKIEVYNNAQSFYCTWEGATSTSTFTCAYGAGIGFRTIDAISYKYIAFYSDGTNWWVLRAES